MPQRTNEFQHLIAMIERSLVLGKMKISESRMLPDKITGDEREVDIVIERVDDRHSILVGIECSGGDSPRPATVEWVERMYGKHKTLTDKLVLVAKGGFTKSAKKKADFLRIKTLTLDEAENCDWEAAVHNTPAITIESFLLPYITAIRPVLGVRVGDAEPNIQDVNLKVLEMPNGETMSTFDVVTGWINDPAVIKSLQELAFTDAGTVFDFEKQLVQGITVSDTSGKKWPVVAIHVEGKCRKEISPATLNKYTYGHAAVTQGTSTTFGRPTQIVLSQEQGEPARCIISVCKLPLKQQQKDRQNLFLKSCALNFRSCCW